MARPRKPYNEQPIKRIYVPVYIYEYLKANGKTIVQQIVERFPEAKKDLPPVSDSNQLKIDLT